MPKITVSELITKCDQALDHLHLEYAKIQTGRASTALVENILVDSYGSKTPLKGIATITIPEPKQISIQPWSRDQLTNIEKALLEANIGLVPQNDGVVIRLNLPPMTEERRKELVKSVGIYAEDARISIRNARHEAMDRLRNLEKEKEISEDELRLKEKEVQEKVDEFNSKVEERSKKKEVDVMTV